MAFAGALGTEVDVHLAPHNLTDRPPVHREIALLFAESNTRFLCEVPLASCDNFQALMQRHEVPCGRIGTVVSERQLKISTSADGLARVLLQCDNDRLKQAWQSPLKWT